jgi:hypothetical protein
MTIMTIKGSCFCGAISYHINGRLKDARSCHCSQCRKAFSSQASAYALVEPDEFHWTSGKDKLSSYQSKDGAGLQFCSLCGSTLCGTHHGKIHGITLGCVEGDPDIELARHIFVASKASWETIATDVPQYDQWPEQDQP